MRLFLFFILLLVSPLLLAQSAHEVNEKLGRGVNYGNMFEAPTETEWGNPWQPEYPSIIAGLGFSHVRMPIRWEPAARSNPDAPYTINPDFLERIKEVIDATLAEKLLVVINMHHHEELYANPDGQKQRFLAQWEQIGEYFKDYPDSLVFEILNEPHGNLTPEKWNEFLTDALSVIRESNPDRTVLIGPAEYNSLGALPSLEIPDDPNIILTIHYYNPFQFTHQGAEWVGEHADEWLGTEWLDSDIERAVVESEFSQLAQLSSETNIPVHIGEFGAYSKADIASRERWTTYLGRYFEQMGWSWAYWEFSAGFGMYNPSNGTFIPELVDALLVNEMPEPLVYERTTRYESDFSTDMDGWFLNVNGASGAQATLIRENDELKVVIDQSGTENWHIQLVRPGISLEAEKKYVFSFTCYSDADKPASFYIGRNSDPWTQYGATSATLTTEASVVTGTADMTVNDSGARIVIDLGSSLADFTLSQMKLELLSLPGQLPDEVTSADDPYEFQVYPNPTRDIVNIFMRENNAEATLLTISGQVVGRQELLPGWNQLDLRQLTRGIYLLRISERNASRVVRVVRQ